VLHEMATNASKTARVAYGGKVPDRMTSPPAGGLIIIWTERDGPPPPPPTRVGFGSSLIELMIERTLAGTVQRDYRPTGLVADLHAAASADRLANASSTLLPDEWHTKGYFIRSVLRLSGPWRDSTFYLASSRNLHRRGIALSEPS